MATSNKPILEIPKDATQEQIKKAYLEAARKLHPDKGGKTEDFQQLVNEYEELTINVKHEKTSTSPNDKDNGRLFKSPEVRVKEEKQTYYYNVSSFKINFSKDSSQEERLRCIFNGSRNNFGFSKSNAVNDSKKLFNSENKEIGKISFLGSLLKQFTQTKQTVEVVDKNDMLLLNDHPRPPRIKG